MNWKIARAKKHFSELIHKAEKEPQIIYNRDVKAAAVINPGEFSEFEKFKKSKNQETLASMFNEFRRICAEEEYEIIIPERKNRNI